ncbi:MAG: alpha/beta fold hydrolase [Candidatus Melainabacteria bacterium]
MAHFQYNGYNIHYRATGSQDPDARVVVLIHGLASSGRIWAWQQRALNKHYRVFSLDLPGHGDSDAWDCYSFLSVADMLNAFLNHLRAGEADLVALSLGCSVALTFAWRYPQRVRTLVLEGPIGAILPKWHPLQWLDASFFLLLPFWLEGSLKLFGHHAVAHWLNTFGVKRPRSVALLESVQQKADLRAVRQLLWQNALPPYTSQLQYIRQPVLIIRGCDDPMPRRFVTTLQHQLPDATLTEVPGTRHIVAMERPGIFNNLLMGFLERTGLLPSEGQTLPIPGEVDITRTLCS